MREGHKGTHLASIFHDELPSSDRNHCFQSETTVAGLSGVWGEGGRVRTRRCIVAQQRKKGKCGARKENCLRTYPDDLETVFPFGNARAHAESTVGAAVAQRARLGVASVLHQAARDEREKAKSINNLERSGRG